LLVPATLAGQRKQRKLNPTLLRYYLDGIQFALGDLPADTTPSAQLKKGSTSK